MNIHEMRSAEIDAAKAIVEGAKSAVREMTRDEKGAFDAHMKNVDQFDAQIKEAGEDQARLARLKSLTPEAQTETGAPDAAEASDLGQHFLKSAGQSLKNVSPGQRFNVSTPEFKATPTVTTGLSQIQYGGVVQLPLQRPTIADLLLSGTMSGTALTYFVEGAVTGAPGAVAENSLKPEVAGQFTPVTEGLAKIAGWSKESDELITDFAALSSVVQSRLLSRLAVAEESQILNGSGTAPNLRGLLNRTGIQTETQAATADSAADAIFRAITKTETATFLPADFIVINPADYQSLRLAKDANGQYYGGGFFSGTYGQGGVPAGKPPLWGLNTVVTSAIAAKTVLVGSGQAAQVFRKGGVRVDVANTNEDDFINNRITVLAEERLLLACYLPAALVKVTLQ
jgi:HK97 family phage major capsid protein